LEQAQKAMKEIAHDGLEKVQGQYELSEREDAPK
jgi:hypothetical protein